MTNHPNRNEAPKGDDYAVQQAGYLLLEVHKMLRDGRSHSDYGKYRAAARRAALRAARALDDGQAEANDISN